MHTRIGEQQPAIVFGSMGKVAARKLFYECRKNRNDNAQANNIYEDGNKYKAKSRIFLYCHGYSVCRGAKIGKRMLPYLPYDTAVYGAYYFTVILHTCSGD